MRAAAIIVASLIAAWVVGCADNPADISTQEVPFRGIDAAEIGTRIGAGTAALDALPWPERVSLERAMAEDDARFQPVQDGDGARFAQPGGPSVRIGRDGARVSIGERELRLRAVAVGRGGAATRLEDAPPVIDGAEVQRELAPGITEWWRALPSGLEHGVTLAERPAGDGALRVELAMDGLEASAVSESGVELHDAGGARVGRYEHLLVLDAEGARVPARMRLAMGGVAIEVDDGGASYPLVIDPLVVGEEATLLASGGASSDRFGRSVALSADGSRALVGAYRDDTAGGTDAGSARVFVRSGGTWSQEATLLAPGGAASDFFGYSVALSADGTRALVGALFDDTPGGTDAGSARVFVRSGASWSQEATLLASGGAASDNFGFSVTLSPDGSRALVGAYHDDTAGGTNAGSARVFVRSGVSWSEEATLLAPGGTANDVFGYSLALSADGSRALVGADADDTAGGTDAGSAWVFVRSGGSWSLEAMLLAPGGTATEYHYFGSSVALSADGDCALVGAPGSSGGFGGAGSAQVFVRSGVSWSGEATLVPMDGEGDARFGFSVALSADGSRALVGAHQDAAGSARVFVRSGGSWSEDSRLLSSGSEFGQFGVSVALSVDGSRALVGAWYDITAGGQTGSARVFTLVASNGTPCAAGSECASGFCTDGVCCASACGGGAVDCQACSVAAGAGADGTCGPLSSAVAPSVTCRAAVDVCDAAESCASSSTACPADVLAPASTECRAAADLCDVAETCSGSSAACPANAFAPATTECRAAADVCDVAEACTGSSAACPSDAFAPATMICRASARECDLAESCTGLAAACPADAAQLAGTACGGAPSGDCDAEDQCSGGEGASASCEPRLAPAGTVCRAASCSGGSETPAASCDGASADCPAAITSACAPYACGADACVASCVSDAECTSGHSCDPAAGDCVSELDAGTGDAGAELDGGSDAALARDGGTGAMTEGGCGCSAPARDGRRGLPALLVLALALLASRSRRSRCRS